MTPPRESNSGLVGEHKNLLAALLEADAPALPRDRTNPHFKSKYTGLDTIAEKIDPLLVKHGLVWIALPGSEDGSPVLNYQLAHATSGEALTGVMPLMLDRSNSQGLGSALTYARRYAKVAVLDLVADDDDDGHAASQANEQASVATLKQQNLIKARVIAAALPPVDFANAFLLAAGREPREFESQKHAEEWANSALERLPARMVDPVLKEIEQMSAGVIG